MNNNENNINDSNVSINVEPIKEIKDNSKIGIIIGILGVLILVVALVFLFLLLNRDNSNKNNSKTKKENNELLPSKVLSNSTPGGYYAISPSEDMINSTNVKDTIYGVRLQDKGVIDKVYCDFSGNDKITYDFKNIDSDKPVFNFNDENINLKSLKGVKSVILTAEGGCDSYYNEILLVLYNDKLYMYSLDLGVASNPYVINTDKAYVMAYLYNYSFTSDDEASDQGIDSYLVLEDDNNELYIVDKNKIVNVKEVLDFNKVATLSDLTYNTLYE